MVRRFGFSFGCVLVFVSAWGAAGRADHVLYDFEEVGKWRVNVYGEGELEAGPAPEARIGNGALQVRSRGLRGGNAIGPALSQGEPWRQAPYDRVRLWVKAAPLTRVKLVFVTREKEHSTYNLHFIVEKAGWNQLTFPLSRCWNRGGKKLDPARLRQLYVNPDQVDAEFLVDHIELLEGARTVHLTPDRAAFVTPLAGAPPVLDGRLDDPAWEKALKLGGFVRYGSDKPAEDQTDAWVTYDGDALYVGARLHSSAMDRLQVNETARDAAVWRDDCLEVFIDANHDHDTWRQFVTNAAGSQFDAWNPGGQPGRGLEWNGTWTVKTSREPTAWVVEMRIPFSDLGGAPRPGDAWGFNVCREAPSTKELSMWTDTGGRFTRVQGLADLVFASARPKGLSLGNVRLEERRPGVYLLRAEVAAEQALELVCGLRIQTSDAEEVRLRIDTAVQAGTGELAVPFEIETPREGKAKLLMTLREKNTGNLAAYRGFGFSVVLPSTASLDKLLLVPSPQEISMGEGTFELSADTRIRIGSDPREGFIGSVIYRELRQLYGVAVPVRRHGEEPGAGVILVGRPDTFPRLRRELRARGLLKRFDQLPAEGHVVVVEPSLVLLAGRDKRGTYYAARTFLQLAAHGARKDRLPDAPACTIVDWPDMPFRGHMIFTSGWPQDPLDEDMLKEFIYKQVAGFKYNTLVWQMKAGYRYSRRPRLANRCGLTRETVRAVADFARDHFLEIIPCTNILGHGNWIVLKYPELKEDGKEHQICTRHPETYPLIYDVLEEMDEVFDHPKRLLVGLDEVRWKTFNLPEEERCERCRGIPKWQVFADHVNTLHEFLSARGTEMWMWGDMLIPSHNGGAPFHCRKALDLLPKDVVICNWSAEYSPGSSRMFSEAGFRVIKSNSRQVPESERPYVEGNLASFWNRHPWCPISQVGEKGLMMDTAYAAEYSWHVNRENTRLSDFRRENDINVLRLLARPRVPRGSAGCKPISLKTVKNRALLDERAGDGKGWADRGPELDLSFAPAGRVAAGDTTFEIDENEALYLTAGAVEAGTIEVRRKAASLVFLHTVVFPADRDARKQYLQAFLAPNEGVPIVDVEIGYADGRTLVVPLRVGMEVGRWLPENNGEYLVRCPYILRVPTRKSRRETPGKANSVLYVYEWPNPRFRSRIDSVRLRHRGDAADYALLALSTRDIRQP